jgi:predicted negative regulator of RcsB-dependent stress response
MNQEVKNTPTPAPAQGLPANLPEELLPVYDWYQARGRSLLVTGATVLLVALAVLAFLRHRSNQNAEASAALMSAETVEGLENLNGQYGRTRVGPLIRIRLAKAYFAAGNYAAARATYEELVKRHPRHELADIARLGHAASLEGEQSFDAALAAFDAFATGNPGHYLHATAVMGAARCLAALQRKPEALVRLDDLIVKRADTPWEALARDLRDVIERFDGFKSQSIFDKLGAASQALPGAPASIETILDSPARRESATGLPAQVDAPAAETPAAAE